MPVAAVHIRGSPSLAIIAADRSADTAASESRLGKCSRHFVWSGQACLHGGITGQALGSAQGIAGALYSIIGAPVGRQLILDARAAAATTTAAAAATATWASRERDQLVSVDSKAQRIR